MNLNNINITRDSGIHRFHVDGDKSGTINGWYIAKPNGWMVYGHWKDPDARYYINEKGEELTREQQHQFRRKLSIDRRVRLLKQRNNAKPLESILSEAVPRKHPYLASKGFSSMEMLTHEEKLVIPIYDLAFGGNRLISMQAIYPDGMKRFASGCRTMGGMHILMPHFTNDTNSIYLCEGLATGLTIATALSSNVAICFYAGNLIHAAEILKTRFHSFKTTVCADNDRFTQGNPGVTAAQKVAKKYDIDLIIPDLSQCSDKATDFNDLMIEKSIEEVRKQLSGKTT